MNKKIFGIFIVTLLISTTMTTIATNVNKNNYSESRIIKPNDIPDEWLEGADQYQTDDYRYGMVISPTYHVAQAFKPNKTDLTAVALYFFSIDAPFGIEITVSIRESLDGVDLTTSTIQGNIIRLKRGGTWIMFDFDDITVTPEETYYIVCFASGGEVNHSYCWFFDVGNKYNRGIAWGSEDSGEIWIDLEDPGWDPLFVELDLCFITYFQEPPKLKAKHIMCSIFEELLKVFPLFERLLLHLG